MLREAVEATGPPSTWWEMRWVRKIRELAAQLLAEHIEPVRLAWAVAIGIFVGCTPFWGLHLGMCIVLGFALGLNKAAMYLAANVANPVTAPFIVALSIGVGEWLRFGMWRPIQAADGAAFMEQLSSLGWQLSDLFVSCILGSVVVGAVGGAVGGLGTWLYLRRREIRARADRSPLARLDASVPSDP